MSIGKGRIRVSIGNGGSGRVPEMWDLGEYRKCGIRASTKKGKIRASTRKGRIRASIGNGGSGRVQEKVKSGRVPEKVGSERVSKMRDPGEYRKCGIWASTRKGRIRASIENEGSRRVPEMWDLGEYQKR